jgi:hypothetical protein
VIYGISLLTDSRTGRFDLLVLRMSGRVLCNVANWFFFMIKPELVLKINRKYRFALTYMSRF